MTPGVALLDVDGTLIDSNDAHARCWVEVLSRFGHRIAFDTVRRLIGQGGDKVFPALIGIAEDDPQARAIGRERSRLFVEREVPRLHATPGARGMLERLASRSVQRVVATSGGDELDPLLQQAGVADLVDRAATSDDAERSKPDPDIVQAALRKSGQPAAAAVMLGDTPYDVQAARRAGVRAVAFRCGGFWSDRDLDADETYDDPRDLLARWSRSVFA